MPTPTTEPSAVAPAPSPRTTDYLTVDDAAALLQCGVHTIYTAIRAGRLRAEKINARGDLRILPEWLRAFVAGL